MWSTTTTSFPASHSASTRYLRVPRVAYMRAVVALRLIAVGKPRKDDDGLYLLRGGKRLRKFLLRSLAVRAEPAHIAHAVRKRKGAVRPPRVDMRTPAALEARLSCKFAHKEHVFPERKRQRALIFQQHGALLCNGDRLFMVALAVKGRRPFLMEGQDDAQNALHRTIEHLFGKFAASHRRHDLFVVLLVTARHLEVEPCFQALHAVGDGVPVAHDKAVESPLVTENVRQEPLVLRSVHPVDLVVRAHHGRGLCVFDHLLKRGEIDLPQRSLAHFGGDGHPARLLVVGGKVLDAHPRPLTLHALNKGTGKLARKKRIFGKILKVAPAQRRTLDVDGRSQQNGNALRAALFSERAPHLAKERAVEGARRRAGGGKTHRLDAVVDAEMIRPLLLLPQTVGAVAHHDGGNGEPLHRLRVPEIAPRAQPGLLFEGHFSDQSLDIVHKIPPFCPIITPSPALFYYFSA